jgi:hypothetical protein
MHYMRQKKRPLPARSKSTKTFARAVSQMLGDSPARGFPLSAFVHGAAGGTSASRGGVREDRNQ